MNPTAAPGQSRGYQAHTSSPLVINRFDLQSPGFSLRKVADGQYVAIYMSHVKENTRVWVRDTEGDWSEKSVVGIECYPGSEVLLLMFGEAITLTCGILSKEKDTYQAARHYTAKEMTLVDLSKEAPATFGIQPL